LIELGGQYIDINQIVLTTRENYDKPQPGHPGAKADDREVDAGAGATMGLRVAGENLPSCCRIMRATLLLRPSVVPAQGNALGMVNEPVFVE